MFGVGVPNWGVGCCLCADAGKPQPPPFVDEVELRSHLSAVHLNYAPFWCHHCSLMFPLRRQLEYHSNGHHPELPYIVKCDVRPHVEAELDGMLGMALWRWQNRFPLPTSSPPTGGLHYGSKQGNGQSTSATTIKVESHCAALPSATNSNLLGNNHNSSTNGDELFVKTDDATNAGPPTYSFTIEQALAEADEVRNWPDDEADDDEDALTPDAEPVRDDEDSGSTPDVKPEIVYLPHIESTAAGVNFNEGDSKDSKWKNVSRRKKMPGSVVCRRCNKKLGTAKARLPCHVFLHLHDDGNSRVQCKECGKRMPHVVGAKWHVWQKHPQELIEKAADSSRPNRKGGGNPKLLLNDRGKTMRNEGVFRGMWRRCYGDDVPYKPWLPS